MTMQDLIYYNPSANPMRYAYKYNCTCILYRATTVPHVYMCFTDHDQYYTLVVKHTVCAYNNLHVHVHT